MTHDPALLLRTLQLSDSSFPSGGFAFSNGLETLTGEGKLDQPGHFEAFLDEQLIPRWASFDRWFLAHAHEASGNQAALTDLDWLCEAQSCVATLAEASRRMGRASLFSHDRIGTPGVAPYLKSLRAKAAPGHLPVVQGLIASAVGLSQRLAAVSAAHQLMIGALSATIRLGKLGALEAQAIQARLTPRLATAVDAPLPDRPHAFSPLADIAAMRHAANRTRLFAA